MSVMPKIETQPSAKRDTATISSGLFTDDAERSRCTWCQASTFYQHHHDTEWGFPVHDERRLFEKICLEGSQAGLSWLTILNKRKNFRAAFANFDAEQVSRLDERDVKRLEPDAASRPPASPSKH